MIEHAAPLHGPLLAAIHAAVFPPAERWSAAAITAQLLLAGTFGLFDPERGMVLARAAGDEAEILTLAVLPPRRRQGSGRALLKAAAAEAAARGAGVLFLEVARDNAAAHALYTACGFAAVGLRPHYYPDGTDAVVMRCPLIPATPPSAAA